MTGAWDALVKSMNDNEEKAQVIWDNPEVQDALSAANESGELDRMVKLAGLEPVIEDTKTDEVDEVDEADEADDEEEQIDEAQSEAQKAAFQKMLDAKNGNKEETTEDADADTEEDDEVEESIELDRVKELAGV